MGEGLPAGAAALGRAALQNHLLELQNALVDVEGVRHRRVDGWWRVHFVHSYSYITHMAPRTRAQRG